MIDRLIVVWLLVCNWVEIWIFLKDWMRGNKRTFPNFHLAFIISMNSNSFHHKTLERRWHDFFHLKWKGFWKHLNSNRNYCKFRNFMQLNDFHEKIKWLLQIVWNMSWKFQRIKLKVPLKLFWNRFSIWSYLVFIQIIFLQK